MDLSLGSCKVDGCGAAVEGEDAEVKKWLTWHVYDDHPDWWWNALRDAGEAMRLPVDPRPDLSLLFPWPPVIPSLCFPPLCNREKGHPPPHYAESHHTGMVILEPGRG